MNILLYLVLDIWLFQDTLKILRARGDAMQNSVPKGEGGMVRSFGSTVENIEKILKENENNFIAQIANDNSKVK